MNAITWFLLSTQVALFLEAHLSYASRLCCDPRCATPISYGKTRTRSLTGEKGHLSYPASAKVTVYSRGWKGPDGAELLEAEISGRKGLVPKENIIEISTLCVPTHTVYSEGESAGEADHTPFSDVDHSPPVPDLDLRASDSGNHGNSGSEEATGYDLEDVLHNPNAPITTESHDSSALYTGSHDSNTPPTGSHDSSPPPTGSHDSSPPPTGSHDSNTPSTESLDSNTPLTRSHDPSAPPTESHDPSTPPTGSHDPSTPPTGSHDPSTTPTGSHDPSTPPTGSHDPSTPPTESHDPSTPPTESHDPSTPTESHDPSTPPTGSHDPSTPPTGSHDSDIPLTVVPNLVPDHVMKWMEEHRKPPDVTDPSTQYHTPSIMDDGTQTVQDWGIKKEDEHAPKDTISIIRTAPFIDLGQNINSGLQSTVGLSPEPPLEVEELDGTPLSLLKLHGTEQHVEPFTAHTVNPLVPDINPSAPLLTPTKLDLGLTMSPSYERHQVVLESQTSEGRSEGQASEGRSEGQASEGRSEGQASEGKSEGQASEGRSEGQTSEGRSEGQASEGRSEGQASEGRSEGQTSEGRSEGQASEGRSESDVAAKDHTVHKMNAGSEEVGTLYDEKPLEGKGDMTLVNRRNGHSVSNDGPIPGHTHGHTHGYTQDVLLQPQNTSLPFQSHDQSHDQLEDQSHDLNAGADSEDHQVQPQNRYFTEVQHWFKSLQQVEMGLMSVVGTLVAMVIPLCLFWCQAVKHNTQKSYQLKAHEVSQSKLEEQLGRAKREKDQVLAELRSAQTQYQLAESRRTTLEEERLQLESELQRITDSHGAVAQELASCQTQFENLKTQVAYEHIQLKAVVQEKATVQQQVEQVTLQVQQLVQRVQELEATKEQLEQDLYTSQQSLEQMQDWGSKINVEYETIQTRCLSLESELSKANSDLARLMVSVKDKDEEILTLRQCLQQVVDKEQTDGKDDSLPRIQAMLDTTKVQVQLRETLEEKEAVCRDLQEQVAIVVQLRGTCKRLEEQVASLLKEKDEAHCRHQETQMKLKGLTEYFEQKELTLHTKLGAQEVEKIVVQNRQQEALEKATEAERERERERVELRELRNQMAEIEKSHTQQVLTNEKRMEEALCQLRKTEEELRQAHRKITLLQKQLAETEHQPGYAMSHDPARAMSHDPARRPPSAGPLPGASERGPAAPPPAPPSNSLPRTSSPSESSQQDHVESAHNASYPTMGARSSYNIPPPSHSADRRQMLDDRPPPPPIQLFRPMPQPWMRPPIRRFPPPMLARPYYRDAPFPPDQLASAPPGGFGRPGTEWQRPPSGPDMPRPPSSGPERPRPPSSGPERPRPPSSGPEHIPGRPGNAPPMGAVPQNIPRPYFGGNSFTQP